ncbi:MAG TPA: polysaccharide deacetylase family protein [Bacilli bacterium]|nr:polysaccharide deacetylase family protein [Bacilli bacterium]
MKKIHKTHIVITTYTIILLAILLGIPLITRQLQHHEIYVDQVIKPQLPYTPADKVAYLLTKKYDFAYNSYTFVGDKYLIFNSGDQNHILNIYNNKYKTFNELFINNDPTPIENLIVTALKQKYPSFIADAALAANVTREYNLANDFTVTFNKVITNPVYDKNISVMLSCNMIKDYLNYQCTPSAKDSELNMPEYDKVVALTFDDGPSSNTNQILDTLKANNAQATFFMLGSKMSNNSDLINTVLANGNEVGGHSYSHKYLTAISQKVLATEMNNTNEAYKAISGVDLQLIRPPYGSINAEVRNAYPYAYIMWSVDPNDWKEKDANKIVENVLGAVRDGDIILMHDTYARSAEAVNQILPLLYLNGYKVVTVSQLAMMKNKTLENHQLYFNFH